MESSAITSGQIMAFAPTVDRDRARSFYRDTLGLTLKSDEEYALVFDSNGTMLRVAIVQQLTAAPFTILGWQVSDIAAAIAELTDKGVRFELFPGMPQDSQGVMAFPGGDQVAWFKDPDGNILSVTQFA